MEITDVIVHKLSLPAVNTDKADASQDACIVEVETDEGVTGIGEADSSPQVVEAVIEAPVSHYKSAGIKEVVLGRDPFDVEALWNDMYDRTYFFGRKGAAINAISAVDIALWDIIGKATGRSLQQLLGGTHKDRVRAYASTLFPADPTNTEYMQREAEKVLDDGFTAVKFGWGGFGQSRRNDLELVGAARSVLGDEFDIMVDAGMVWQGDVKGAIKRTKELDREHDIYWMEEPFYADNLDGYRRLSEATDTRVAGGEEEYTIYGFREFVDRGKPDVLQPDVARSGGITHLEKIASLAVERGIPIVPHGYSTDIIIAANLQLIAANRNTPLLEYCIEDSPLRWDLVNEDLTAEDGYVEIPDRPGLGITLNRDILEEYRMEG